MLTETSNCQSAPITTYYEEEIGKTLYCVTNVYKGEIEFGKAMESLIINKILREENPQFI